MAASAKGEPRWRALWESPPLARQGPPIRSTPHVPGTARRLVQYRTRRRYNTRRAEGPGARME
eukprot:9802659-Alexandrium_andersonii.AAC.1